MTFAAPWFLAAGLVVAGAVTALHFLARRRPRALILPTARFVPNVPSRAPAFASRPADLLVLLLRIAAVLVLATAFARPVTDPPRRTARVILADGSRAVRSVAEVRDSVAALLGPEDLLVFFDSASRRTERAEEWSPSSGRGSLSAALLGALRASSGLRTADSLELVMVSPLVAEEWDAATEMARGFWPGRARLVRVAAAPAAKTSVTLAAAPDDPLRASLSLTGLLAADPNGAVRVRRSPPSAADSAWAQDGGALVHWPADPAEAGWPAGPGDTIGAVTAANAVVVAPFARRADPPAGVPIAWWVDGRVAATEQVSGRGCIRSIAIPLPSVGDVALRPGTQRLVAALVAPCGGTPELQPLDSASLRTLAGGGALLAVDPAAQVQNHRVPATGWLLLIATLLVLAEPMVRRRAGNP